MASSGNDPWLKNLVGKPWAMTEARFWLEDGAKSAAKCSTRVVKPHHPVDTDGGRRLGPPRRDGQFPSPSRYLVLEGLAAGVPEPDGFMSPAQC